MKRPQFTANSSAGLLRALAGALAVAGSVWCGQPEVLAQPAPADTAGGAAASYITPFPPGDVYKLQVYGDGFTEGLLQGLSETIQGEERIDLQRKPRGLGSLVRQDIEDELRVEEQSKDVFHIAVVTLGVNDRGSLRSPGASSVKFGTPNWKDQYGQRVDRLLKVLKRRGMAVYVVGTPPLRRQEANSELELVNEVLVERSFAIRFIDVAESFADENGAFSQFGPDSSGNREKLRDGDGVGFTTAGYRKLAGMVVSEIKRDLALARAERAVPLAGSEVEQKRINPEKSSSAVVPAAAKVAGNRDARASSATQPTPAAVASGAAHAATGQPDLKADTTRIGLRLPGISGREDLMQVEVIRPSIPAAVIALLARKETADSMQQPFELLADDVGDGVSVSTMVTALGDGNGNGGRRKVAGSQAAYASVWVKGERLTPKVGRADDFSWPKPAYEPDTVPVPAAAPAKAKGAQLPASGLPKARLNPATPSR